MSAVVCICHSNGGLGGGGALVIFRKANPIVPPRSGGSEDAPTWLVTPLMPADSPVRVAGEHNTLPGAIEMLLVRGR